MLFATQRQHFSNISARRNRTFELHRKFTLQPVKRFNFIAWRISNIIIIIIVIITIIIIIMIMITIIRIIRIIRIIIIKQCCGKRGKCD